MRRRLVAGVLPMLLGAIAPVATADEVPDISGTRTGRWSMADSGGAVTLTVKQDGSTVTGDIALRVDLKGAREYNRGPISGAIVTQPGGHVLSFTSGRLRADLGISDAEIRGPFCLQLCGTMSFPR